MPSPDFALRPETGAGAPCLPSTLLAAKTAATHACSARVQRARARTWLGLGLGAEVGWGWGWGLGLG